MEPLRQVKASVSFRTRRSALVATTLLAAAGCGARSELVDPVYRRDAGSLVDRVDVPTASDTADVPVIPEVRCPYYTVVAPPARVFGAPMKSYAFPAAVARSNGFDVATYHNDAALAGPAREIAVRHVSPDAAGTMLVAGAERVLRADVRSMPRFAVDGDTLGACFAAESTQRITMASFGLDDTALGSATAPMGTGDLCLSFTAGHGRFAAFWHELYSMASSNVYLGILDASAHWQGDPTLQPVGDWGYLSSSAYDNGFAWVSIVDRQWAVSFLDDTGHRADMSLAVAATSDAPSAVVWPFDRSAIALLTEETTTDPNHPPTAFRLRVVSARNGIVLGPTQIGGVFTHAGIAVTAPTPYGLAASLAEYDDYGSPTGTLHVYSIGADGATHGPSADVRFTRGITNDAKDFSIATAGDDALVAWTQREGSYDQPAEVWAALFRCAR